jgi:ammonia channel protein AmtB
MSSSAVLKAWEACDLTDTAFVLVCTVFCWPIIPAVGLAYSGYSHRRNGMSAFIPSLLVIGCCTIQWFFIGYSLAYGDGSGVIGDLKHFMHKGVLAEPVGTIPAILFSEFQLIFCATVCAISVGGGCERGRVVSLVPFIFVSSSPFSTLEITLTLSLALGNLHLLSACPYGLVRKWVFGATRSA